MKCQRCLSGEEASCRVRSEVIDMKVCAVCADEARSLVASHQIRNTG